MHDHRPYRSLNLLLSVFVSIRKPKSLSFTRKGDDLVRCYITSTTPSKQADGNYQDTESPHNVHYQNSTPQHHIIRGTIPSRTSLDQHDTSCCTLEINQYAEMERSYTYNDVRLFTSLIGDQNPIHQLIPQQQHPTNENASSNKAQNRSAESVQPDISLKDVSVQDSNHLKVIVPGLLVGSLFSAIIGTLIPGAIYIRQSYDFRHPVHVSDTIVGRIVITKLRPIHRHSHPHGTYMICQTLVYNASPTLSHQDEVELGNGPIHTTTAPITTSSSLSPASVPTISSSSPLLRLPPEIPPLSDILIRGAASVWIPQM